MIAHVISEQHSWLGQGPPSRRLGDPDRHQRDQPHHGEDQPIPNGHCEEYSDKPWPHDDCAGAGVPCENDGCEFSIRATGLVCPSCRRAQGEIKTQTHHVIGFLCRECGYRWHAETGRVAGDVLRGKDKA